jgi:hypothetical protein
LLLSRVVGFGLDEIVDLLTFDPLLGVGQMSANCTRDRQAGTLSHSARTQPGRS